MSPHYQGQVCLLCETDKNTILLKLQEFVIETVVAAGAHCGNAIDGIKALLDNLIKGITRGSDVVHWSVT